MGLEAVEHVRLVALLVAGGRCGHDRIELRGERLQVHLHDPRLADAAGQLEQRARGRVHVARAQQPRTVGADLSCTAPHVELELRRSIDERTADVLERRGRGHRDGEVI
jgi:hypothetical protein